MHRGACEQWVQAGLVTAKMGHSRDTTERLSRTRSRLHFGTVEGNYIPYCKEVLASSPPASQTRYHSSPPSPTASQPCLAITTLTQRLAVIDIQLVVKLPDIGMTRPHDTRHTNNWRLFRAATHTYKSTDMTRTEAQSQRKQQPQRSRREKNATTNTTPAPPRGHERSARSETSDRAPPRWTSSTHDSLSAHITTTPAVMRGMHQTHQ
jgi:hypothetical protein